LESKVKLNRLRIDNYRCFEKLECEFDNQLNLLIGWNGTGKSSLLYAIRDVLRGVANALGQTIDLADSIHVENVRFEMQTIGTRVRREYRHPTILFADCTIDGSRASWTLEKNGPSERTQDLKNSLFHVEQRFKGMVGEISRGAQITLPFFAFYGPRRNTQSSDVTLPEAASGTISRAAGYEQWQDALIDATEFQAWVIGKTLENLQIYAEEGPQSPLLLAGELAHLNKLLLGIFPNVKGLRYDLRLRLLAVEYDDQTLVPFASLSDGQRAFIMLIADIARRMLIINPHLNNHVFEETPGIVMIDELDIHLHPEWQRKILQTLCRSFPSLQIFATTHSPKMVSGIAPSKVLVLDGGTVSHPQATYGLDVSRILEDVMQTGARETEVEDEIRSIFSDIDNRNFERAKIKLSRLKTRVPELPEYIRAEALIRRLEVMGK
jgi:predicted ATP-binding protein involved in virulence